MRVIRIARDAATLVGIGMAVYSLGKIAVDIVKAIKNDV